MVIVLVAGLATGLPVAVTLGFTSLVGLMGLNMPLEYMAKTAYTALNSFTVIAIPMFILSGAIMESGGLTKKLVSFAREFVGGSKGGLAVITVLTCSLFAAISGSGPATTAAIGTILVPAMIHEGYDKAFAGSVACLFGRYRGRHPAEYPSHHVRCRRRAVHRDALRGRSSSGNPSRHLPDRYGEDYQPPKRLRCTRDRSTYREDLLHQFLECQVGSPLSGYHPRRNLQRFLHGDRSLDRISTVRAVRFGLHLQEVFMGEVQGTISSICPV